MGLAMARKFRPVAMLLDIGLPDTTGWAVLDQLQHDPDLRHIPVHMLSIYEDRRRGLSLGAAVLLPQDRRPRSARRPFSTASTDRPKSGSREVLVVNAERRRR